MREMSRPSSSGGRHVGEGRVRACGWGGGGGLQPKEGQRSEQVKEPGPLGPPRQALRRAYAGSTWAAPKESNLRALARMPLLISGLFTGAVRGNNRAVSGLSKEASCQDIKAKKDAFSSARSSDRAVNRYHLSS